MKRSATAKWTGDIKQGQGKLATASGILKETPYSYHTRFENGAGTNPEELIAAAHAGCFTMALSAFLGRAGFTPETLETTATVHMEQEQDGWSINAIHLETKGQVPGIVAENFEEIAANAKANCPVSKALNAKITLEAKLV